MQIKFFLPKHELMNKPEKDARLRQMGRGGWRMNQRALSPATVTYNPGISSRPQHEDPGLGYV